MSIIILIIVMSFFFNKWATLSTDVLTYKDKNTLVIGASRTAWSLNEHFLDSTLNVSSNGDGLFYSLAKLKLFTKKNPQINKVILCFDNRTLDSTIVEGNYNSNSLRIRLPIYSYYLSRNELKEIVNSDYYSVLKSSIKIPLHSLQVGKEYFIKKNNTPKGLGFGGYNKIVRHLNNDSIKKFIEGDTIKKYTISNKEVNYLSRIINYCEINKIKLLFINPPLNPVMYYSNKYQEGKKVFDRFYEKNLLDFPYMDYSNKFLPDSCYADLIHLNYIGANIFSKEINLDSIFKAD